MTDPAQPELAKPSSRFADVRAAVVTPMHKAKKPRSIRDCMAVERTIMSNERTLLAYVRTALAVLVVAVTVIKFFDSQGMVILGYVLLVIGVACVTIGLMRFTEMYHRLAELGRCDDDDADSGNDAD